MAEPENILRCNFYNCCGEVNYICYCQAKCIYLCTSHHHNEVNHRSTRLYKHISEFDRKNIIELCKKCKNDCMVLKSNLLKECQEYVTKILKAANELTNNIRQAEILYDNIITFVCENNKVRHIGEISLIEKIISSEIGSTLQDSPYWEVPKIKIDMNLTINDNQLNLIRHYEDLNPFTILTFFKQSTKIAVNVLINNDCKIDLFFLDSCPENLGVHSSFCYLPDGTLFSNGGNNETATNFTYIINPSTRSFTKKSNSNYQRYNSGNACYYKGYVYVFCGLNISDNLFNLVERYDLNNNTWTNFTVFPENISHNSSVALEDGIFISGKNISNVYKLNSLNNTYEVVFNIPWSSNKFMILAMETIFLFDNSRLFEYSKKKWKLINSATNVPDDYNYCCPVRNGEYTYFMLADMSLYRFSFITKKSEKLAIISI